MRAFVSPRKDDLSENENARNDGSISNVHMSEMYDEREETFLVSTPYSEKDSNMSTEVNCSSLYYASNGSPPICSTSFQHVWDDSIKPESDLGSLVEQDDIKIILNSKSHSTLNSFNSEMQVCEIHSTDILQYINPCADQMDSAINENAERLVPLLNSNDDSNIHDTHSNFYSQQEAIIEKHSENFEQSLRIKAIDNNSNLSKHVLTEDDIRLINENDSKDNHDVDTFNILLNSTVLYDDNETVFDDENVDTSFKKTQNCYELLLHGSFSDNENETQSSNDKFIQNDSVEKITHIPDQSVPSRAKASLPTAHLLFLYDKNRSSVLGVYACRQIPMDVRFGPLEGIHKIIPQYFQPEGKGPHFLLQNLENNYQINVSDENTSNWMRYVRFSPGIDQNVFLQQCGNNLYFITSKHIESGAELIFGYGATYEQQWKLTSVSQHNGMDAIHFEDTKYISNDFTTFNEDDKNSNICNKSKRKIIKNYNTAEHCDRIFPKYYRRVAHDCTNTKNDDNNSNIGKVLNIRGNNVSHNINIKNNNNNIGKILNTRENNLSHDITELKKRNSEIEGFYCPNCDKRFKRKDKLKDHIKRQKRIINNNKEVIFMCNDRNNGSFSSTQDDSSAYLKFVYKCHPCHLGFKRRGMLVNHLARRHPEVSRSSVPELQLPIVRTARDYFCQHCDKVYKSSSKRKAHILKNHPGLALPPSTRGLNSSKTKETELELNFSTCIGSISSSPHHCPYTPCHKQYASKAKLSQHIRNKHVVTQTITKTTESKITFICDSADNVKKSTTQLEFEENLETQIDNISNFENIEDKTNDTFEKIFESYKTSKKKQSLPHLHCSLSFDDGSFRIFSENKQITTVPTSQISNILFENNGQKLPTFLNEKIFGKIDDENNNSNGYSNFLSPMLKSMTKQEANYTKNTNNESINDANCFIFFTNDFKVIDNSILQFDSLKKISPSLQNTFAKIHVLEQKVGPDANKSLNVGALLPSQSSGNPLITRYTDR